MVQPTPDIIINHDEEVVRDGKRRGCQAPPALATTGRRTGRMEIMATKMKLTRAQWRVLSEMREGTLSISATRASAVILPFSYTREPIRVALGTVQALEEMGLIERAPATMGSYFLTERGREAWHEYGNR